MSSHTLSVLHIAAQMHPAPYAASYIQQLEPRLSYAAASASCVHLQPRRTGLASGLIQRPSGVQGPALASVGASVSHSRLLEGGRVVAAFARRKRKNPQPDKLMDGVEQLVDEHDIEKVAFSSQPSAEDVAAAELSLDCNRFLIGRSMINDRVSDHEEGITWLRSAPRLLWVARERRAKADREERQRRREK